MIACVILLHAHCGLIIILFYYWVDVSIIKFGQGKDNVIIT